MKKNMHPNSLANLEKGKNSQFGGDMAAILGKKGAESLHKKNKQLKLFREYLNEALKVEAKNAKGESATLKEISMIKIAQGCANGNMKSIELALKILGELTEEHNVNLNINKELSLADWKEFAKKCLNKDVDEFCRD